MASAASLREENGLLHQELARVEDRLAQSQAERDELAIKYSAVSQRLEQALKEELGDPHPETSDPCSLTQQNASLRRRMEDDMSAYKRKLQTYQEGQQRQALLVQKLQGKVVQYKKRCGDLEQQLMEKEATCRHLELSETARFRRCEEEQVRSLENALIRLEEEQQRCASLAEVNTLLREQLNQANAANQALSEDLRKLTEDWSLAREELELKESDWRREEENYNDYLSGEQGRFLALWKKAVNLRRHLVQVKTATDRDLAEGRADFARLSNALQAACLGLGGSLRAAETGSTLARARQHARAEGLEHEVREKAQEFLQLQIRSQAERAELNARISELSLTIGHLDNQTAEKDKNIQSLREMVEMMVC